MKTKSQDETTQNQKKRSAPRYWIEIKGKLYARLQYKADDGKYKVKYKPITDKRIAKRVVEEMRQELSSRAKLCRDRTVKFTRIYSVIR